MIHASIFYLFYSEQVQRAGEGDALLFVLDPLGVRGVADADDDMPRLFGIQESGGGCAEDCQQLCSQRWFVRLLLRDFQEVRAFLEVVVAVAALQEEVGFYYC